MGIALSSNGRTAAFEAVRGGSNPPGATKIPFNLTRWPIAPHFLATLCFQTIFLLKPRTVMES